MARTALVLANGHLRTLHGKTAHGLIRGSRRFTVVGVIDPEYAGQDGGTVLDGTPRGIPIFACIDDALAALGTVPDVCIIGIATHGGALTPELRELLKQAASRGMSLVNGLHEYAGDDPEISAAAARAGVEILDVRKPKPKEQLHFWTGAIATVRAPRLAILGMDCAIGKRTTCALLADALNVVGVAAEMIYTGQTGWMLGAEYGFVLDSVVNDFVSGELEHAIVSCDRERSPDCILIEGQASLRNPCGPCGAEILLSGGAKGVILQHAPGRVYFEGFEEVGITIPPITEEIRLIAMYGAMTLGVTVNGGTLKPAELERHRLRLEDELGIPVVDPTRQIDRLVPVVRSYIEAQGARSPRGADAGETRGEAHP